MVHVPFTLKHPKAQAPAYTREGDSALDLTAAASSLIFVGKEETTVEYDTGVAFEIPEGYVGVLASRSSLSNTEAFFPTGIGVIDSNYRGTVRIRLRFKSGPAPYSIGQRCCQILFLPAPKVSLQHVDTLSESSRGTAGFGSSGN